MPLPGDANAGIPVEPAEPVRGSFGVPSMEGFLAEPPLWPLDAELVVTAAGKK